MSIIGKRFGKLTVISLDHIDKKRRTHWKCKCDCGNEKVILRGGLTSGDNVSCGCYHKERTIIAHTKHGSSRHPLYSVWSSIIQRCTNPNADNYNRFGGKGITICEEWKNDFSAFYDWAINNGYVEGCYVRRLDFTKEYSPENCYIENKPFEKEISKIIFSYNGINHPLNEWASIFSARVSELYDKINNNDFDIFNVYPYSTFIDSDGKPLEWKEIPGNSHDYAVNNTGVVIRKSKLNSHDNLSVGAFITQRDNSTGYYRVTLSLNGESKYKSYFVHRLVAEAFIEKVDGKDYINHIDGNKHNNSRDNLEWCTFQENIQHARDTGLITFVPDTYGEKHAMHKLLQKDVDWIRENHKPFDPVYGSVPLAKKYGVRPQTITDIVHFRTWKPRKEGEAS